MRVDVVAVGTELLLGQIIDTNSSWIGEQLAAHGFDSLMQTKVGDNLALHYDFSLAYSGEASVSWVLRTGFLQSSRSPYVPGLYASTGSRFISFDTASVACVKPATATVNVEDIVSPADDWLMH